MIITEDQSNADYQIKAYSNGKITVNQDTYTHSLIICAQQLITDWPPQTLSDLSALHWQAVLVLKPEIILLGTGKTFIMPPHALLAEVYAARVGIECMDTGAACRTYTALSAENRRVIAALLIH